MHTLSETVNKNLNLEVLLKEISAKLKEILKVGRVYILLPKQNLIIDQYGILRRTEESMPEEMIGEIEKSDFEIFSHSELPFLLDDNTMPNKIKEIFRKVDYFGKKYGIELTVPIRLGDKLIGLMNLGEKLSGELYTNDDMTLLKTFANQAAVAIEKARLYEQVKNYSEELEKKVEARTAELKILQEEQKQMMLEIAHGLQTPLTIIKSELSLLENEKKDHPQIGSLGKTIDRTSKFIYDMLRLARIESESKDFKNELIDLSQLLEDLADEFMIIAGEKNIVLKHMIDPGIHILGDQASLAELITNLVSNSVKYIKGVKTREITISLMKKKKQVELSIADTGIGINPEDLKHLFERFYRAKDGRGNDIRGTGLGLAISKKIVEMHKGKIKAQSQVDKGTQFIISFPCMDK